MADQSPQFVVDDVTGESVSYTFPTLTPEALAIVGAEGLLNGLDRINLSSPREASHSLAAIDVALDELAGHEVDIRQFLTHQAYPFGEAELLGLSGAEFAVGEFGLLPSGTEIDHQLEYSADLSVLQDSEVFSGREQSGFVGVRIPEENGWSYGWLGVEIQGDSSLRLLDYAWNPHANVVGNRWCNGRSSYPIAGSR